MSTDLRVPLTLHSRQPGMAVSARQKCLAFAAIGQISSFWRQADAVTSWLVIGNRKRPVSAYPANAVFTTSSRSFFS